ncbi:MAG: F0F1 ATP synthase subunit epsilon [Planctomycetes bacterium]|nr:F0F1 ATP synthase subunit epsilon [Planctomycetota bacterium]
MTTRTLESEIAEARDHATREPTPAARHALALVEARADALVVQVSTPQRGTPFVFEQAGQEGGKPVREKVPLGCVTARRLVLPAHDGRMAVLSRHAPMIGLLGSGEVVITTRGARLPSARVADRTIEIPDGAELRLFVSGGTFEVRDNRVLILAASGFCPDRLALDDIESEEERRALQARIAEQGLEGDAFQAALLEAKRQEVRARRNAAEARDPSPDKAEELGKIRAMEKLL